MFDRIDASTNRTLGAFRAMRVCCSLLAQRVRLVHDRVQFLLRELGDVWRVGEREHAARRAHLDDVGAVLDVVANRLSTFVRAVDDSVLRTTLVSENARTRPVLLVAVASRGADGMNRYQHSRTRNDARCGGVSQAN